MGEVGFEVGVEDGLRDVFAAVSGDYDCFEVCGGRHAGGVNVTRRQDGTGGEREDEGEQTRVSRLCIRR